MFCESIRHALVEDSRKLAEVYASSWYEAYKNIVNETSIRHEVDLKKREQFFNSIIQNTSYQVFVIERNSDIVGLIVTKLDFHNSTTIELIALYILPMYWRSGLGSYAICYVKELYSRNRNIVDNHFETIDITLWVLEENIMAINFYEKNGFENTNQLESINFNGQIKKIVKYKLSF